MQPLKLSDAELDAVFAAARPLPRDQRDAFMQTVAVAISGLNERGPGATYRVIRDVQRQYFDPPIDRVSTIRHGGYNFRG
jgi:hypothetical protein